MQLHLLRFLREDFARVGQAKLPQFILKRSKKVKTSIYIYMDFFVLALRQVMNMQGDWRYAAALELCPLQLEPPRKTPK